MDSYGKRFAINREMPIEYLNKHKIIQKKVLRELKIEII